MSYRVVTSERIGTWGVTIVRDVDELVAVIVNGDQALAERICELLNTEAAPCPTTLDFSGAATPFLHHCERPAGHAGSHKNGGMRWQEVTADSCTCTAAEPDRDCPVHKGRRPRGPKPPPIGPGCICDGSGRACPRHGAVI